MLVFSACLKTGGCKIKGPKSTALPPKKIRVCVFEKENRNEATLQVLTEYIEPESWKELCNR